MKMAPFLNDSIYDMSGTSKSTETGGCQELRGAEQGATASGLWSSYVGD